MLKKIHENLTKAFPNAIIEVNDYRHDGTHIVVNISSEKFQGLNLVDQHKLVYAALADMLESGEIHALKIKTSIPEVAPPLA